VSAHDTFLEAAAHQREHASANWENLTRDDRRRAILRILAAQRAVSHEPDTRYQPPWLLAAEIAARLDIPGMRRAGRGAVKGSWSGYMSPALRVVPSLRSLVKDRLVYAMGDPNAERYRTVYWLAPDTPI
jgi:hypothetical protein